MTRRDLVFAIVTVALGARDVFPQSSIVYLQQTSDRYQHTVDVSTDADAAGNHFAARGRIFSAGGAAYVPPMDEISVNAPCFGITCITAQFISNGSNWGGWYWLNGVLGPGDGQPSLNWGDQPNAGFDLSGATTLQFWARGAAGGEVVEFFAFGVGNTEAPFMNYPDSSLKASLGLVPLSTTWTKYQIQITGRDIHYVLGGFGWSATAQSNNNHNITFYLDDIQFVKQRPADARLLVSYETVKSSDMFDIVLRNVGYVYDNAVALIALTAAGDQQRARTIADALLYAQAHDRFFTDSRLRNGYQAGDIMLPPGWLPNNKPNTVRMPGWYAPDRGTWFEDQFQVSTNTGNVAWAMLGLLYFYEATHEQKYLQAVDKLGDWIIANTSDTRGSGGYTGGYEGWENGAASGGSSMCVSNVFVNGQCKRLYKATEHNIDLYAAFSRLYAAEGLQKWATAAQNAKTFFLSTWDANEGKFWTGTTEDGVAISKDVIPLDIQAWALQALGSAAGPYVGSLSYVEAHHKTTLGYGFKQNGGNSCGDNTWFEGSSQVAVSYSLAGNQSKRQSILNGIHSAQAASGAMPATDGQCMNTGFFLNDGQPWKYFPRLHVGATAWLSLAEMGVNPFAVFTPITPPALNITKSHTQNFTQGQKNAMYTVTVSNSANAGPTSGTVTVTESAPAGLTLTSMTGNGWTCALNVCSRGDALAGGASYPTIAVAVDVAANASSPQINQVSASGGGSAAANATDSTIITPNQTSLSLSRNTLNFGFNGALVTSPQTVSVNITQGAGVNWTAVSNQPNITVSSPSGIGTGTVQVRATAGSSGMVTITAPGAANSPQNIQVNVVGVTVAPPFGSFDTPVNNTTGVVGAIPVSGWALDPIEVTRVDIFREPVGGEPAGALVLIGTAVFSADARPDVAAMFPTYPYQYRAGWGYQMLTNFLPNASGSGAPGNGTYRLHAIAFGKSGSQQDLGTKTITVDNAHAAKPFGTIDTPGQGGTISGSDSVNFAWALTPQPAMIPTDGSTITVVIDGAPVGHPVYNQFRSDIANLFPGYANSMGAVGFFHINTTTLANGVHTISWNVFDNLNRGEGLGSRYFNVLNTGGGSVAAPEDAIPGAAARFHRPDPAVPDADGGYSVTMEEVGRIELNLDAVSGNMLVEGESHTLPAGSTLKDGVFYWQPGPGFLGEYTMQFQRPDGSQIQVRVNIVPKRYQK
ncbi:MAG TPA: hypothetical protein VIX89_00190 [Bryobacteraceae bacterium]